MRYIFRFVVFLFFVSLCFKAFAAEEDLVDFSLKKVTKEEQVFFESFQDLYNAITSTTGPTKLKRAGLEPLVILSESETSLNFGMAQSVCTSYNVFSAISGKSCYVAKAQNVDRIKSILRYGKQSPSYGDVNINADFLVLGLKDLYQAQKRQGKFADLPYLNAVMFLNSKVDLFFVNVNDKRFTYLDELVAFARDASKKKTKQEKVIFKVGVFNSQNARDLMRIATEYNVPSNINVQIITINASNLEKRFCNTKTADVDLFYYSGEYHEENLSALYDLCDSRIALLPVAEYGYNVIKDKKFYAPVDLTEVLKYKIKRNTLARTSKVDPKMKQKSAEKTEVAPEQTADTSFKKEPVRYEFKADRIYVSAVPYVLAATRYTHVKDVFYVVMSYSYNFYSSKTFQPALDTQSLDVIDLFKRPLKVEDLVFHNGVNNYLTYYQVYSLATRRSESENLLVNYMTNKAKQEKLNNIAGPAVPDAEQVVKIMSGNKENQFYQNSYLLRGLLERDFDKIRNEKIYGNATSGRFKVDGIVYGVGYIDILDKIIEKDRSAGIKKPGSEEEAQRLLEEEKLLEPEQPAEEIIEEKPKEELQEEALEEAPEEVFVDPLLSDEEMF